MAARTLLCLSVLLLCAYTHGAASGPKTLVLLDDLKLKSSHSAFFASLSDRGHELTFSHVYDEARLSEYGVSKYANLILFCPTAEDFGEHIQTSDIINFIDNGGNVLIAAHENVTEPVREIANECGVDFDEEETQVIDHLSYDVSDTNGYHTLLALPEGYVLQSKVMLGDGPGAPILFRGIGHAVTEGSRLLSKVLTGTETSYSANPREKVRDYPQSAGKDSLLVTAIQARNNARIVFAGSLEMFSNRFFNLPVQRVGETKKHDKSGNEAFCRELSVWTFQERGLLRATKLTHNLVGSSALNPPNYRVKDNIHFSVVLEQFDGKTRTWVPFTNSDVQLEFVMIDPYIRKTLSNDGKGKYSLDFQVPDVYGVFKFRLQYHKAGWSNLDLEQQVSVHPFRHDEFERFIDVAYPYYLSTICNLVAFFLFGFVFLYNKA